jgi:DNA-binding HxlR family transcriptional regulator
VDGTVVDSETVVDVGTMVGLDTMAGRPQLPRPCPMAASLDILGERWTLLAIREMGYGVHRFDQIARFTGASRDILTDRLRKLEAAGVVERRRYSEHPPRFEYHLTEAGLEAGPILLALAQWGQRWAPWGTGDGLAPRGRTAAFAHDCGHPLEVDGICHRCGGPLTFASLRVGSEPAS